MATNPFDDLALRYVLADDEPVQVEVAKAAAVQIETTATTTPATTRNAVGQWVASINRWLGSQADDEDDIISRAKALGFLAKSLEFLNRDLLKADQIKLLIGFFTSLFSSDHKAGIEASSKALGYLVDMKAFQPTTGNDIITGITKLGSDDFKRQTPTTRLEIYQLVRRLLQDPVVANDLAYKHGNTAGFMTALVDLCRNERDPQNLILWFEIQKLFLQNFTPVDEVTEEVFKTFSAYFPITLRASATPSGITVDDLKRALRSCFSAHDRIARLAVPFLLNKLDQGEAVTVSVKVDILQTLEACLALYGDVKRIAPFADQIWSSLKFEVRNGEIRDSIEATLKTIGTLAKRLDNDDLQAFFAAAWIDLSDDITTETHTESAGQLLSAISGSSRQSFSLSSKQSITHIVNTFKHSQSPSHQSQLLGVLNVLLQVRAVLSGTEGTCELEDELFGDVLFADIYAPSWSSWTQREYSNDRPVIVARLIDGMSYMVTQKSSDGTGRRLCSDDTCDRVFSWLGTPSIIYPLEGRNFLLGSQGKEYSDIIYGASNALKRLAPIYPQGFHQLLNRFLDSITNIAEKRTPSRSQAVAIRDAGVRLSFVGFSTVEDAVPFRNIFLLVAALVQTFSKLVGISSEYWHPIVDVTHLAIRKTLDEITSTVSRKNLKLPAIRPSTENQNWAKELADQLDGLPEIDSGKIGDLANLSKSLTKSDFDMVTDYHQFQLFSLGIVSQLYRHSLIGQRKSTSDQTGDINSGGENENIFLHQLGQFAASVIRSFSAEDQLQLDLAREAFLLFDQHLNAESRESLFQSIAVVTKEDASAQWALRKDLNRVAPLVLGILQGLWPTAMRSLYAHGVLTNLCERLMDAGSESSPIPPENRAALDAILAVLSNKLNPTWMDTLNIDRESLLRPLDVGLTKVLNRATSHNAGSGAPLEPDATTSLEIFRSVLHFLAGDIANYKSGPTNNQLLSRVAELAPVETTIGRQLAQCFEILVSPKNFLTTENHAVMKRLRGQWIYHQVARPYLDQCFPRQATPEHVAIDDRAATNRSVAIFAILKHMDYAVWRNESSKILLVVIRSLQTFGISKDNNTVLAILIKILDADADLVQEHLKALITRSLAIYEMAGNVSHTSEPTGGNNVGTMSKKEAALCRKSCLQFIGRLPKTFETVRHNLLPQRQAVLRGLSRACGDPVREVREVAIAARRNWDALS